MKVDPQRIESPFDEGKFPQSELHQLGSLVQNVNVWQSSIELLLYSVIALYTQKHSIYVKNSGLYLIHT